MNTPMVSLSLPKTWRDSQVSLTSLPWPAGNPGVPVVRDGVGFQALPLFPSAVGARLRRYLILTEGGLPPVLPVGSGESPSATSGAFSHVEIRTLSEATDKKKYVYRECEAALALGDRRIVLRMGLRAASEPAPSWWQWVRAERVWQGSVAEAWRIGGHLVPYTVASEGRWENKGHRHVAECISKLCGDSLHGDLFVIVWKSGVIQVTAHFKSGYFHHWPKAIAAHPILAVGNVDLGDDCGGEITAGRLVFGSPDRDRMSFRSCASQFTAEHPGSITREEGNLLIIPWRDLRVLASKDADNTLTYLDPGDPNVLPPGVSRSFWFTIGLDGTSPEVGRYQVPPSWYRACGEIASDRPGPAAENAAPTVALMREHTWSGGMDTGRIWRYLRRDLRENRPYQDGPEWDATAATGLFKYSFHVGENPAEVWEPNLQHAYHAADVSIYHGSWMPRLECSAELTAPISKYRAGGLVHGYLETGDPYLLETARSLIGVYMAAEWANEPRQYIGRDAYPVVGMLTLWDYSADRLYLEFTRDAIRRLLATQNADGGFSGQGGVGVYSGSSCLAAVEDIGFACGLLSPLAVVEWAARDTAYAMPVAREGLERWLALMLRVQPADGIWLSRGSEGEPYALICAAAMGSVVLAGRLLDNPQAAEAIRRMLASMNARNFHVAGTHAYLAPMYAHLADSLTQSTP